MRKRIQVILLVFVLLITGTFMGCGKGESKKPEEGRLPTLEEGESELPLLRIFDKNVNGALFDDPVAEKIMEKTGVKIEMINATTSPSERLELMLFEQDFPDIILMEQGEMVNQYIEADAFLPLDDLIAEYGQNIQAMYGEVLERSRYSDGKIYWLANWYGKDTDASAGVLMRKDYLIELVGEERANSTEPFTLTEYTQLLKDFQERFPTVNGQKTIPFDLDSDTNHSDMTMKGIFGMKTYGEGKDGTLHYLPATERFQEALLYLNKLYREHLLCKQWVIEQTAKRQNDMKKGLVFSVWESYWDTDEVNEFLRNTYGPDAQYYSYKVVADDLKESQTTYNGRNSLGWDAIGISKSCQNPEAAIRLLDYLASEEGQYLLLWGVEGQTWDMVDGKRVPQSSFIENWMTSSKLTEKKTGVRRWKWMIKNGKGSDGSSYDLTTKYLGNELAEHANKRFLESDYWDTAEYSGLEPSPQSNLGIKWQKIEDLYSRQYAQIICAASEKEAIQMMKNMKKEMELEGLSECEKYISEQYKLRKEQWNIEK